MPIWRLTPLVSDCPDWNLSTYRGEVIVRAKDEEEARDLATNQFAVAATGSANQDTLLNPWENEELVVCEPIQAHDYQDSGPSEILSPRSTG